MEKREFNTTRLKNDANGNPRYAIHFLEFLTKQENHSSLLSWAGVKYELALLRASRVGGKKFHNKQYGGGIVFQSYDIQGEAAHAFPSFEASPDFTKGYNQIALTLTNDRPFYEKALGQLVAVFQGKKQAKHAFYEILSLCEDCAKASKLRSTHAARWIAACYVVLELEDTAREMAEESKTK